MASGVERGGRENTLTYVADECVVLGRQRGSEHPAHQCVEWRHAVLGASKLPPCADPLAPAGQDGGAGPVALDHL